jgi:NitT/TauT family transport system substrate-binding protein
MKRPAGTSKLSRLVLGLLLPTLLVAGCGGTEEEPSATDSPAAEAENVGSVRIGIGSDPATALYVVAHERGIFAANGVDSEIRQFASGGEAVGAQVSGEVDLTSVTELPLLSAVAEGAELGVLGTMGTSDENFGAVAVEGIQEAKDLAADGVRVGVTENSGGHFFLYRYAQENGMDLADLDIAFLQVSDLVSTFARGDIQAFFSWTPNVQQGEAAVEGAHVLAHSGEVGYPTTMYVVASKQIVDDAALSQAVMASLIEASEWVADNRDEALEILSGTFNVPADALELPMSLFEYDVDLTAEQRATFEAVAQWMVDSGRIQEAPSTDFLQPDALREIDPSRVTL